MSLVRLPIEPSLHDAISSSLVIVAVSSKPCFLMAACNIFVTVRTSRLRTPRTVNFVCGPIYLVETDVAGFSQLAPHVLPKVAEPVNYFRRRWVANLDVEHCAHNQAERKVSPTRRRWQSIWNRNVIAGFGAYAWLRLPIRGALNIPPDPSGPAHPKAMRHNLDIESDFQPTSMLWQSKYSSCCYSFQRRSRAPSESLLGSSCAG